MAARRLHGNADRRRLKYTGRSLIAVVHDIVRAPSMDWHIEGIEQELRQDLALDDELLDLFSQPK